MKYYYRKITKRVFDPYYRCHINQRFMEIVYTDHIDDFNKRKRIKFEEMGLNELEDHTIYTKLRPDLVYTYMMEW